MKRLLSCLNFVGTGVLGVIDAFWAGVGAIARHPQRAVTPPRASFDVTVGVSQPRLVQKGKFLSLCAVIGMTMATMTTNAAVEIAKYPFDGNSLTSTDLQGESTAGNISVGAGLPNSGATLNSFRIDKNDMATSFSTGNNDYISFVVTATAGNVLNLNGGTLTFDVRSEADTKQVNWVVRSSVGVTPFNTDLNTGSTSSATFAPATAISSVTQSP